MQKIKILHCADVHLGSEMMTLPKKSKERRGELLRTFRKITDLCREEDVEILLIAGDLFEGSNVDSETVQSVKSYLGALSCPVFISPGNHDYISLDSPYLEEGWPENVKIFKGAMERVLLEDKNVAVYGAGFTGTYQKKSMLQFEEVDPSRLNLLCIHGDVVSPGQKSEYHAMTLEEFRKSGMDYVALGHIHKREDIGRAGDTFYAYPGCPEGRGFDELGSRGVYLGELYKGHHGLRYVEVCQRQYIRLAMDITGLVRELEVEHKIRETLQTSYGKDYEKNIYQISLTGTRKEEEAVPVKTIEKNLSESIYHLELSDERVVERDYEILREEVSLRGLYVRNLVGLLEEARETGDEVLLATYEKALEYGMTSFEGQVNIIED
ncbi:metallophosphoesterase family protein [Proteiniclasticum ruminis]|uniref:DNA repair exonuclease SbcCD nuclease subunit n=1 Tax=Proteiniclasticum ruminis TaxID=398199 RepID=A0A1I5B8Z7_9CLOT|nr:DNA repair exonuclease [Proteiniclasticum ruminis]SFN71100.1 DNA repair exonuclease SbcCD nuclease subunit [Proteiniclasticum ruminis]